MTENRGALIRDHESGQLKKRNKKILTGTSVPLDLPANGRPGAGDRVPLVANQKENRERFSRIDMKRDLSWRNYTSPDLTANLDLDPVIASTRFALSAFFAGSIFTAGSPNLLAARAHEGHTSILSRTTPPSSVVT
jgi:hypothetical protein